MIKREALLIGRIHGKGAGENQHRILTHHPMNGREARKQAKGGFRILMQYFLNAFQR